MNKTAVRDQILLQLRQELALQTRAAQLSREEAISEESRPENQYDMHSQEAAYLAEGQARLAAEIAANIVLYETLTIPATAADVLVALGPQWPSRMLNVLRGISSDPGPAVSNWTSTGFRCWY